MKLPPMIADCLRDERHAEQIERSARHLGWSGQQDIHAIAAEADGVSCHRSEIGEQCADAMHGQRLAVSHVGLFGGCLATRGRRRLGFGLLRGARYVASSWVVLVEQHGRQAATHVPFEIVGNTDTDPFSDAYSLVSSAPPDFVCIDWTADAAASLDFPKDAAPERQLVPRSIRCRETASHQPLSQRGTMTDALEPERPTWDAAESNASRRGITIEEPQA